MYRDNGAIGALLDEYELSLGALKGVISDLSLEELLKIVDHQTEDKDCRSIQTILSHVIESGYTYVIEIRKSLGETVDYKNKELLDSIEAYKLGLDYISKILSVVLLVISGLMLSFSIFIMSLPENIFHTKRPFEIETMTTGYKFIWTKQVRPDYYQYHPPKNK